jgi:hypothetical protein
MEEIVTHVNHETQSLQKACHKAKEADAVKIEPDPGMMQFIREHHEVPEGDAVVKPVEGLKKRHGGRKQAAGRRGEL